MLSKFSLRKYILREVDAHRSMTSLKLAESFLGEFLQITSQILIFSGMSFNFKFFLDIPAYWSVKAV